MWNPKTIRQPVEGRGRVIDERSEENTRLQPPAWFGVRSRARSVRAETSGWGENARAGAAADAQDVRYKGKEHDEKNSPYICRI